MLSLPIKHDYANYWASLVAKRVKNMPATWKTWVRYMGREDPLEKEWQHIPVSCLENPMDRGA